MDTMKRTRGNVALAMALLALSMVILALHSSGFSSDLGGSGSDSEAHSPRQLSGGKIDEKKRELLAGIHLERREEKVIVEPVEQDHFQQDVGVCSREDLRTLVSIVRSDPERSSLRSISFPKAEGEGKEIHFSGLDSDLLSRTFLDRRTAIYGDSTLNTFYLFIEIILRLMMHDRTLPFLGQETLSETTDALLKFTGLHMGSRGQLHLLHTQTRDQLQGLHTKTRRNIELSLGGDNQVSFARVDDFNINDGYLSDISYRRPKVILANIGLHMLHMQNYGRSVNTIRPWLEYENFLEGVLATAEASDVEVVLFKTTNFVCDEKYRREWKVGRNKYLSGDSETLDKCFSSIREHNPDTISNDDIKSYCENAVISDHGAEALNKRLYQFVGNTNVRLQLRNSPLKIAVFNDHDIESCEYTMKGDGRHYHKLNLARVRLLGNYLDCLYSRNELFEGPSSVIPAVTTAAMT